MEITEVRIKLVANGNERLRAFCSITLDGDFVIRDLKIIDGSNGPFVAMPSRKLMDRCPRCSAKNHLRGRFCNECGAKLNENRAPKDPQGRAKLHADVAHPINAACRERVQNAVVEAFHAELERAKSPDYRPVSMDDFEDFEDEHVAEPAVAGSGHRRQSESRGSGDSGSQSQKSDDSFSDYNELIQDLKRDAQQRRPDSYGDREHESSTEESATSEESTPASEEPKPSAPRAPQPAPQSGTGSEDFGLGL